MINASENSMIVTERTGRSRMGMSYFGIRKWCDRITAFDALRSCLRVDARAFWEEGCGADVGRLGIGRWLACK